MSKCMASENGVYKNIYGYGTPCNGYSDKCSLKPHYDTIERVVRNSQETVKRAFGIKGDRE